MKLVVLLYPDFTMLDAIGPIEVLSLLPEADVKIVATKAGIVWPDNQAVPFFVSYAIADIDTADMLLIPGGPGSTALESDEPLLDWVRAIHKNTRFTCSVCTGSLILAAAGLLEGAEAATHWSARGKLSNYGATPVAKRWAQAGKIYTAAGVSAGIDLALHLAAEIAGQTAAQAIQLGIEYDPQPPFDSGALEKATPDILAAMMGGAIAMDRSSRTRPPIPDGF